MRGGLLMICCISTLVLATGGWRIMSARGEALLPCGNPASFTTKQWGAAFAVTGELPLTRRLALWADLAALNAAYVADPLGEGPGGTPDPDPLCDFAHVDCVTYVEQVLALALAPDYAHFPDILRRIRYRDGKVDYRWRNHYTVSDWLPANAWLLRDVTDEVGAGTTATMTKTIARGKFFAGKGLAQYSDLPEEQATTSYIPRERVKNVLPLLKTGDLAIFVIDTPGIIAGHVGLLRVRDGIVLVQHASLTAGRVVTVPLADYLTAAPTRVVGVKIARLK